VDIDFQWLEDKVLLRKLSGEERDILTGVIQPQAFKSGEVMLKQGQAGGVLYLLRSGSAVIDREDGDQTTRVATIHEGAMFGEMTFLTGEEASATVIAKGDCMVYKLTRTAYSELMQRQQDLVYSLFAYILIHAARVIRNMNEEHVNLLQYIAGRRV
jgi:CRP/FNR family cyclic AMP-dependent transcriptional regulator